MAYTVIPGAEKVSVPPSTPPHTEVAAALGQELDQRRAEAMAQCQYHAHELDTWQSVAAACAAALESLSQKQDVDQGQAF